MPDGQKVVSASSDKTLKLWDLASGVEIFTFTGHTDYVTAVAITPDGQTIISGSVDKTLKLWNLASGTELCTLVGHKDYINAIAVTPDGRKAISAGYDNALKVWDLKSRQEITSFIGDSAMFCCAVAPDGVTIVAGEASGRSHFLQFEEK